jgi:hypothetical protein
LWIALVAIVLTGLASRLSGLPLPIVITKHVGDALWATMFYVLVAIGRPRWPVVGIAVASFAVTAGIEFFKLYRAPWVDALREEPVARFLLGTAFAWGNFVSYVIGTGAGVALDVTLFRRARR